MLLISQGQRQMLANYSSVTLFLLELVHETQAQLTSQKNQMFCLFLILKTVLYMKKSEQNKSTNKLSDASFFVIIQIAPQQKNLTFIFSIQSFLSSIIIISTVINSCVYYNILSPLKFIVQSTQVMNHSKNDLDYQFSAQLLGKGALGQVYKGRNRKSGELVALKITKCILKPGSIKKQLYQKELRALKSFEGKKNIVQYIQNFSFNQKNVIVTQLCQGGNLKQVIRENRILRKNVKKLMNEIIMGYLQIYQLGYIHRDLKTANIFITGKGYIRIGDFGFAILVSEAQQQKKNSVGSINYMAPQVHKKNEYSFKSDIWALGIIYYELLTGERPWQFKDQKDARKYIEKIKIQNYFTPSMDKQDKNFLSRTLCQNIYQRANPQELKNLLTKDIIETPKIKESKSLKSQQTIDQQSLQGQSKMILQNCQKITKILMENIEFCKFELNILKLLKYVEKKSGELKRNQAKALQNFLWKDIMIKLSKIQSLQQINSEHRDFYIVSKQYNQISKHIQDMRSYSGRKVNLASLSQYKNQINILNEALKEVNISITEKSSYSYFVLFDHLVTLRWLKSIESQKGIKGITQTCKVQTLSKNLLKILNDDRLDEKKVKDKHLQTLQTKLVYLGVLN